MTYSQKMRKMDREYYKNRKQDDKLNKRIDNILKTMDVVNSYCRNKNMATSECSIVGCACCCRPSDCKGSGITT
jgi:C-terminal processing protease CtpA/Prc